MAPRNPKTVYMSNETLNAQPASDATGQTERSIDFIVMPSGLAFHNACNEPCDMLVGPCVCGAWHRLEDLSFRILNQLCAERWRKTSECKPTETRTGEVVAVFAATSTFWYACVPDEPQDVAKYPERYPYWLPLPKLPSAKQEGNVSV